MYEPSGVRLGERPARLPEEGRHALRGLGTEARDDLIEVETVEQLHDVVEAAAVVHAEVVELDGVRRAEPGRDLCLPLKPSYELLVRRARGGVVPDEFHRGWAREQAVSRQPDFAHPAGAEP
jgi:hypothetical protein